MEDSRFDESREEHLEYNYMKMWDTTEDVSLANIAARGGGGEGDVWQWRVPALCYFQSLSLHFRISQKPFFVLETLEKLVKVFNFALLHDDTSQLFLHYIQCCFPHEIFI